MHQYSRRRGLGKQSRQTAMIGVMMSDKYIVYLRGIDTMFIKYGRQPTAMPGIAGIDECVPDIAAHLVAKCIEVPPEDKVETGQAGARARKRLRLYSIRVSRLSYDRDSSRFPSLCKGLFLRVLQCKHLSAIERLRHETTTRYDFANASKNISVHPQRQNAWIRKHDGHRAVYPLCWPA